MKNKGRKFVIVVGILLLIWSLLTFLSNGMPSQLLNNTFWGVWFIIMGMTGIFRDYEQVMLNKNFYITLLGLNLYIFWQ